MRKIKYFIILTLLMSINCYAEEIFEKDKFIVDLNNEIKKNIKGVTFKGNTIVPINSNLVWIEAIAKTPQDFAVVALDNKGKPVDIFGASTPFNNSGGLITVPGYTLPIGGSYKTVGAAGWNKAAIQLAAMNHASPAPSKSISKAIGTISNATDYIAKELCSKKSRPTKLILNLNAETDRVIYEPASQIKLLLV